MIEAWFDGCTEPRNPGGHGAWGGVVKVDGRVVFEKGGYVGFGPTISNNVSEYSAFIAVAEEILKYAGPAIIRGDSKLVIMQLQGKWRTRGGLYMPYYHKAMLLWAKIRNRSSLSWVPREENDVCDVLSKQVLKDKGVVFRIQLE